MWRHVGSMCETAKTCGSMDCYVDTYVEIWGAMWKYVGTMGKDTDPAHRFLICWAVSLAHKSAMSSSEIGGSLQNAPPPPKKKNIVLKSPSTCKYFQVTQFHRFSPQSSDGGGDGLWQGRDRDECNGGMGGDQLCRLLAWHLGRADDIWLINSTCNQSESTFAPFEFPRKRKKAVLFCHGQKVQRFFFGSFGQLTQ